MTLTRERSSGRNIFDASQKTILKQPDGITTERVVKQTFANVTVRGKNCDDSEAGLRKQAKLVDNILEHTSRHNKSTKARLLAKIINNLRPRPCSPPKAAFLLASHSTPLGFPRRRLKKMNA